MRRTGAVSAMASSAAPARPLENELIHAEAGTDPELAELKTTPPRLCEEHDAPKQQIGHKAPAPAAW